MAQTRFDAVFRPIRRVLRSFRSDGLNGAVGTVRHGIDWRRSRRTAQREPREAVAEAMRESTTKSRSRPERTTIDVAPQAYTKAVHPLVSVIVTTLDRSELVSIALRSVQMQDLEAWECVVVDDGSTDDTVAVAQTFADADTRFRVVRHDHRRGLAAARNTGIAVARSSLVCFLDDDDFLLAGSLSARYRALGDAEPDVVGAFCDWINTDPEVALEAFKPTKPVNRRGQITFTSLRAGPPFIATSPLLRRRVLLEVGGFDEAFRRAEDSELWHRILRLGYRFVDADHVGVAYRRSPGSMVLGDPVAQITTLREIESRADAPGDGLVGYGPRPIVEPLSSLAADALRAPTVYRYLAMVALTDVGTATAMGLDLVPPAVRAEIEPAQLSAELIRYVRARCSVHRADDVFRLEAGVRQLVRDLIPPVEPEWKPIVEVSEWLRTNDERARTVGRTPEVVSATTERMLGAIVLIVEAIYHVDEFGPLADELRRRGRRVCFMLSPKTVPGAHSALGQYADHVLAYDVDAIVDASAVVVLNDWGPVNELIGRARAAGVPTLAKVEGVQDFDDVDTGRVRRPYQSCDIVLGQGHNDVASLPDQRVEVVGSTRLERIWLADPIETTDLVLVNLNFTYNVLTDQRQRWIETVRRAVDQVGAEVVVSMHPAERARSIGLPVADKPFRHLVTRAGIVVSRFSTVPFEAMARGVPFAYHNPHGERVPTFAEPNGAFAVTRTSDELAGAIHTALDRVEQGRDRWAEFFLAQVDVDPGRPSEVRTADLLDSVAA